MTQKAIPDELLVGILRVAATVDAAACVYSYIHAALQLLPTNPSASYFASQIKQYEHQLRSSFRGRARVLGVQVGKLWHDKALIKVPSLKKARRSVCSGSWNCVLYTAAQGFIVPTAFEYHFNSVSINY